MDFWDVVEGRRSVRAFEPQEVPKELLKKALAAAQAAPSSKNSQPWRFHVCTGESRVKVGECLAQGTVHLVEYVDQMAPGQYEFAMDWYSTLGHAPVVIAVSRPATDSDLDTINALISVGGAVENLLLALHAQGLGGCNITFVWWVRDELSRVLDLGPEERLTAIVAVGFPADDAAVQRTTRADRTVWHD